MIVGLQLLSRRMPRTRAMTAPRIGTRGSLAIPPCIVVLCGERNDHRSPPAAATSPDREGLPPRADAYLRLPILQHVQAQEDVDATGDGPLEDRQGRSIHLHGVVVFVISVSPASVASVTVGPSVVVVTIIIVIVVGEERGGAVIVDEKGRAG